MIRELWESLVSSLEGLGAVVRFLLRLIVAAPRALTRYDLIAQQIFNSGALSLVIIMLSGLFVGMVLGLQGFQLLQRFGSEEALGTAATIGAGNVSTRANKACTSCRFDSAAAGFAAMKSRSSPFE